MLVGICLLRLSMSGYAAERVAPRALWVLRISVHADSAGLCTRERSPGVKSIQRGALQMATAPLKQHGHPCLCPGRSALLDPGSLSSLFETKRAEMGTCATLSRLVSELRAS